MATIVARQVDPRLPEYASLPLTNGENIESGTTRLLFRRTAADEGVVSPKYEVATGDVVYSKLRPYLRKVVVASEPGLCSADSYPLRPDLGRVDPQWMAWMLVSDRFTRYATDASARARMPKLNRKQLFAYEFDLPALEEQRRLAVQLTTQMAAVRIARHGLEVKGTALSDLRSHVFADAFPIYERSGFFATRLGDVARLIRGVTFEGSEASYAPVPEAKPILRAGNISDGLITDRDLVWVPSTRVSPDQLMRTGDIAICMSSGSPAVVGKSALLTRDFAGSVGAFCAVIRPTAALPEYVAAWLQSPSFDSWRSSQTSGASIQNLKLSSLAGAMIRMPSLDSQARIIRKVHTTLYAIDAVAASLRGEKDAVEALPAALLRRAFEGIAA